MVVRITVVILLTTQGLAHSVQRLAGFYCPLFCQQYSKWLNLDDINKQSSIFGQQ